MRVSPRLFVEAHRKPSITFPGKNRWAGHSSAPKPHPTISEDMIKASPFLQSLASGSSPSSSSSSSSSPSSSSYSSSASSKTTSGSSVSKSDGKFDYEEWNSPQRFWLGRYKFEDAELEAVMSGGATNA